MSHLSNESELFTTLSDEQQELVAGGIGVGRLAYTDYLNQMSAVQGKNFSGPGGSSSQSAAVNTKLFTSAFDKLKVGGFGRY